MATTADFDGAFPFRVVPARMIGEGLRPVDRNPNVGLAEALRKRCNCKNSKCLKLYCECFSSGNYCYTGVCNCHGCRNNAIHSASRRAAILSTLERNPDAFRPKIHSHRLAAGDDGKHKRGCNCKRSGCLKKYCECFQGNIYCSKSCKCKNCRNFEGCPEREAIARAAQAADAERMAAFQRAALRLTRSPMKRSPVKREAGPIGGATEAGGLGGLGGAGAGAGGGGGGGGGGSSSVGGGGDVAGPYGGGSSGSPLKRPRVVEDVDSGGSDGSIVHAGMAAVASRGSGGGGGAGLGHRSEGAGQGGVGLSVGVGGGSSGGGGGGGGGGSSGGSSGAGVAEGRGGRPADNQPPSQPKVASLSEILSPALIEIFCRRLLVTAQGARHRVDESEGAAAEGLRQADAHRHYNHNHDHHHHVDEPQATSAPSRRDSLHGIRVQGIVGDGGGLDGSDDSNVNRNGDGGAIAACGGATTIKSSSSSSSNNNNGSTSTSSSPSGNGGASSRTVSPWSPVDRSASPGDGTTSPATLMAASQLLMCEESVDDDDDNGRGGGGSRGSSVGDGSEALTQASGPALVSVPDDVHEPGLLSSVLDLRTLGGPYRQYAAVEAAVLAEMHALLHEIVTVTEASTANGNGNGAYAGRHSDEHQHQHHTAVAAGDRPAVRGGILPRGTESRQ
jgi:hypothetical protein